MTNNEAIERVQQMLNDLEEILNHPNLTPELAKSLKQRVINLGKIIEELGKSMGVELEK